MYFKVLFFLNPLFASVCWMRISLLPGENVQIFPIGLFTCVTPVHGACPSDMWWEPGTNSPHLHSRALRDHFRGCNTPGFLSPDHPTFHQITDSTSWFSNKAALSCMYISGLWWFLLCISLAGPCYPDICFNITLPVSVKVFFRSG